MDRKEIEAKVASIIKGTLGEESLRIQENDRLIDDLELSSLEVLELLSALEEEFDCRIAEKKSREFVTVRDIVEYIIAVNGGMEA